MSAWPAEHRAWGAGGNRSAGQSGRDCHIKHAFTLVFTLTSQHSNLAPCIAARCSCCSLGVGGSSAALPACRRCCRRCPPAAAMCCSARRCYICGRSAGRCAAAGWHGGRPLLTTAAPGWSALDPSRAPPVNDRGTAWAANYGAKFANEPNMRWCAAGAERWRRCRGSMPHAACLQRALRDRLVPHAISI